MNGKNIKKAQKKDKLKFNWRQNNNIKMEISNELKSKMTLLFLIVVKMKFRLINSFFLYEHKE
jgi:hypothetical protein